MSIELSFASSCAAGEAARFGRSAALFACAIVLLGAMPAAAQDWMERDSGLDLRLGERESGSRSRDAGDSRDGASRGRSDGGGRSSEDFQFTVSVPLRYTSRVVGAGTDSLIGDRPDWHSEPDLSLRWSRQYDRLKATAEVGITMDRYAQVRVGDIDTLYGSFKLAATDGKSDLFVPYATYITTMYFVPTFETPEITFHDAAVGFSSGIGLRGSRRIAYQDSSEPGDGSVLLDLRVGRRMSDQIDYQNTFLTGRVELAYAVTKEWRAEVTPRLRVRWYEDYFGEERRDVRPGIDVALIWAPEWLKRIVPRGQIAFHYDVYRNYSNLPEKNYSVWEAGPTLEMRAKF